MNDNPVVLEFHHLDPKKKKYNISTMNSQCMRLEDIQAELKKCIVACSNCHKSKSYEEVLKKAEEEYSDSYRLGEIYL